MSDPTVYHAQSQCRHTGSERLHRVKILDNGHMIRVYRDNFNQYRVVIFKTQAHSKGYAGVCLDTRGNIRHYEIAPAMTTYNASNVLVSFLRSINIKVSNNTMALENFVTLYLDYRNNFLTVEAFATYYGMSLDTANKIVEAGRLISSIEL